jgi:Domain of unknown function (DUF4252)
MKHLFLLFICFFLLAENASAQPGIRRIYRKYKRQGTENTHFMLPRPIFWVGSLFPKRRDERKLVRSVRNVRILAIEDGATITPNETRKMLARAEASGYEPLLTVREHNTRVAIHAKERKGKIRGLFIVVHEADEFVLISLKTRLKYSDVEALLTRLSEEDKIKKVPIPLPKQLPIMVQQNVVVDSL